jgi:hypothetical protein
MSVPNKNTTCASDVTDTTDEEDLILSTVWSISLRPSWLSQARVATCHMAEDLGEEENIYGAEFTLSPGRTTNTAD